MQRGLSMTVNNVHALLLLLVISEEKDFLAQVIVAASIFTDIVLSIITLNGKCACVNIWFDDFFLL